MQIDHVNIVVNDLEKMVQFYTEILGLKETKRATISGEWISAVVGLENAEADVVYVQSEQGPRIELLQYRSPAGVSIEENRLANTHGIRHLAFRVDDIDAIAERLYQADVRLFGPVQDVPNAQVKYADGSRKRLVYFYDPENNVLEICSYS